MGCGSSSAGYSPPARTRPKRTKPPVTFEVNQEKQGGPEAEKVSLIQVKSVSFLVLENCFDHHTDEYDITEHATSPKLVVRRGQSFRMQVELDRSYNPAKDKMSLEFDIGSRPSQTKQTLIKVDLDGNKEKNNWNASIIENSEKTAKLIISVTPSPSCIIGRWGVHIRVSNLNSREKGAEYAYKIYTQEHKIYILFNPWCKEDTVFLDDEGLKNEYILNESGKVYYGSKRRISGRSWNFGQFDGIVLDCVLDLLGNMEIQARASSIMVVRQLTALVNNLDGDNGILVGNWSGDYGDGKSPTVWSGSVAIIEQYYQTKRPVKYGQCWVFSAVLTTCCRTLGIPARSVTNFASAHDTDSSITIDKHVDQDGNAMKHLNDDSVWNFHVWNDVWMTRPDIKGDYGGWQACDATPQEKSDGVFCCGPCPLKALKAGDVSLPYDGHFIFAEMNADRVEWILNEDHEFEVNKVIPNSIGFNISTHLPKCKGSSSQQREDVTSEYKHAEGSSDEKAALNNANRASTLPGKIYGHTDNNSQDVQFELKQQDDIPYGQPYNVEVGMENKSGDTRNVLVTITLKSLTPDSHEGNTIKKQTESIVLQGGDKNRCKMTVPFDVYQKETLQFCNFMTECSCKVKETNHLFVDEDSFNMDKPDLDVKGPKSCGVGESVTIEVSFTNTLPITLTNCTLDIEGGKIQRPRTIRLTESVGALELFKKSFDVTPTKVGTRTVNVVFNSKDLENISGSLETEVKA